MIRLTELLVIYRTSASPSIVATTGCSIAGSNDSVPCGSNGACREALGNILDTSSEKSKPPNNKESSMKFQENGAEDRT
jgi:hypothetical protein